MSNIWRVRTAITGGSGAAQLSTQFFDQAAGGTAQHAADAVHAFWTAIHATLISGYIFQVEHIVEDIDVATGQPTGVTPVTATSISATDVGTAAPWATQGLIEWHSGVFLGGREIRGRLFVPGVPQGAVVGGAPSSTFQSDLQSAATALATDANSSLCVYSRKHRAIGVVTSGTVWNKFAVLRSRRD